MSEIFIPAKMVTAVAITIPFVERDSAADGRILITAELTRSQRQAARALLRGYTESAARLATGRPVATLNDAIKMLLEQIFSAYHETEGAIVPAAAAPASSSPPVPPAPADSGEGSEEDAIPQPLRKPKASSQIK